MEEEEVVSGQGVLLVLGVTGCGGGVETATLLLEGAGQ